MWLTQYKKHKYMIAIIGGFFAALIAFIITWKVSDFFIPLRDRFWSKSGFAIFLTKLNMAGGAAFLAFTIIGNILNS